jgi:hypothetical protein
VLRPDGEEEPEGRLRDDDAEPSAEKGEDDVLGENMAKEPPSPRSERAADRERALPSEDADEREIGNVVAATRRRRLTATKATRSVPRRPSRRSS